MVRKSYSRWYDLVVRLVSLLIWTSLFLGQIGVAQDISSHRLGPEDVVQVTVLRHPEFSGEYLIPQGGTIEMPVVGKLAVSGMTLIEFTHAVTESLKVRLLKPEVSTSLRLARLQRVFVLGYVKIPGALDLKPGWRAAEALAVAGGILSDVQPSDIHLTLERANKVVSVESLDDALGSKAASFELRSGDVLRVDTVPIINVCVSGSVRTPGFLKLRNDSRNLLAAISQAGGVTADASTASIRVIRASGKVDVYDLSRIFLRSTSASGVEDLPANIPPVSSGDTIVVPQSQSRVAVIGAVRKPGFYTLADGQSYTLADAFALAEGTDVSSQSRARLSRVGLGRIEGGKEVRRIYDLGAYFRTGKVTQNPAIHAGDIIFIPQSNQVDASTIFNGISSFAILFTAIKR